MRRTAARAARASRSAREYLPKAFPSLDADDVARELAALGRSLGYTATLEPPSVDFHSGKRCDVRINPFLQ